MNVSVPNEAILAGPDVQWGHVDGPLLHWAGNIHWLTYRERFRMFMGWASPNDIGTERWPHLAMTRSRIWYEQ